MTLPSLPRWLPAFWRGRVRYAAAAATARVGGFVQLLTSDTAGGLMARRLLPVAVGVPPALAGLSLLGQRTGLYDAELGLALMVAVAIGVLSAVVLWNARWLHRLDDDRKRVEEDVRTLNDELGRRVDELTAVNEELDAYSYTISHDLRAPLRAMQGFSQALIEDHSETLDATGKSYARRIVSAAARMDGLIQDLLAYSRVGRAELPLGSVDLGSVIAEALAQVEGDTRNREARVEVEEEPLPSVTGHHATLVQAVANLLTNAVKFVPPGRRPEVRLRTEERDGFVRLCAEDNGIGIDPEHRDRIFRLFERLHGVDSYPGTGVGLAIVRKAVARMGGRVGVEPNAGLGSRFWVELPKVASDGEPAPHRAVERGEVSHEHR